MVHLVKTPVQNLSMQTRDSFPHRIIKYDLYTYPKEKLLRHIHSAPDPACIISFAIIKLKSGAPPLTVVFVCYAVFFNMQTESHAPIEKNLRGHELIWFIKTSRRTKV